MQIVKDILAADAECEYHCDAAYEAYEAAKEKRCDLIKKLVEALNLPKGRVHLRSKDGRLFQLDYQGDGSWCELEEITPVKVIHIDSVTPEQSELHLVSYTKS